MTGKGRKPQEVILFFVGGTTYEEVKMVCFDKFSPSTHSTAQ